MTKLWNDPATFTEDLVAGFLDANAEYVVGVPGGVVRATTTRSGKVAVVTGGGSGHYPAFCGTVGPGFADGAVIGNVFTSPSAAEAASVARAAHGDAGVILTTGNYAGDVLNFGLAVQQLRAAGIDARYLAVTDDIASAGPDEHEKRRGIAGDFTVFKIMSAAAEEGYGIDDVYRVGKAANAATRTLGVAFDGCTLPGADQPLFTVPVGRMGVGLGIHGEPGVSEQDQPRADELATLLVEGVLAEVPADAPRRLAVILNGLGRTKYEELFVVWGTAARLLREAGFEIVRPEVGELVTSLDMAGCSLTITWLDEELERLWLAPADTPTFRRGALRPEPVEGQRRDQSASTSSAHVEMVAGDAESQQVATKIADALAAIAEAMAADEEELGRIDAVAGDGDHGRGMVKGSQAASTAAREAVAGGAGAGGTLRAAGEQWAARAGGTSGVLWGAALTAFGARLGDAGRPDGAAVAEAVRASYQALIDLGGAQPGDKTMLDAWLPFTETVEAEIGRGADWPTAWTAGARAATEAAERTAELRPKVGRARPLAERSVGTPDAGAVSFARCVTVVAELYRNG
ncbi:dihydroxyacetone kinase family protein [Microlunatus parietis]|uniref:Dihydroxyacetone kinase n=1 Tax=Microlunatus parietis TaxID=682979 RepID=A0A7Y9LCZ7_9ACTN|nr:dihydroxyacetone kinase family protein [Microlunatus parietis]NYE72373.1 dihydroxyacetone kinase [Microlunatus parietis]